MADCKGYLNNSGIDVETLKKIVYLTNPNNTESISMDEFCMMLHLIFLVKKENLLVPETLPLELSYLRRDFVKDLAKSNVSANEIVVVKDQVAEADKQRLMDLTEFRKKYEAVQQKGMANLEKVRKNNQESLMKKNADLEFMNKVLENYKNLLMKVQKECGVIENETNYVKDIVAKGNTNDGHLIREVITTVKDRNNSKASVEKEMMNLVYNYDTASDKLVEMLDRERNSKGIKEK